MGLNQSLTGLIEPRTKSWEKRTPEQAREFYSRMRKPVENTLRRQLLRGRYGYGKDGRPFKKRKYRRADRADGPVLDPHGGKSRTVRLIATRATDHSLTVFWHTNWGQILTYHAEGQGHLPVRDPRLSKTSIEDIQKEGEKLWRSMVRGTKYTPDTTPEPQPKREPEARPRRAPAPTPKVTPTPSPIAVTGRVDFDRYTFGIGGNADLAQRALDAGTFSGFSKLPPRPGRNARPAAPTPAPKPRPVVPISITVKPVPIPPARPISAPKPPVARPTPVPKPKPAVQVIASPKPAAGETIPPKLRGVPVVNPALPAHRKHVELIRAENSKELPKLAAEVGLTVEEYSRQARRQLQSAIDHGDFYLRVDSGLIPKILGDARFKTQFETNTSNGSLQRESRELVESRSFGLPVDTPDASRPIYGYVSAPDFGSTYNRLENRLETYGDAVVRFRRTVRARATITVGDSLTNSDANYGSPAVQVSEESLPITRPTYARISEDFIGARSPAEALEILQDRHGYVEAQYQGGITVEDVEEIAFIGAPPSSVQQQLAVRGIKWRVLKRRDEDED